MKYICVFLLLVYSSLSIAYDIELTGGYSQLTKGPNGTWYQDPFPSKINLKSRSGSIGIIFNKDGNDYWRFGYTYLGNYTSEAVATASDENYNPNNPPTYCNGRCWDMSHWYGHSVVQGLYVSKVYGLPSIQALPLKAEIGLFIYNASWTMTIPDWKACELCGPQYLQVKHKNIPYGTPFFSIGVDKVFLTYYHRIQAQGDKWPTVFRGPGYRLEYRLSF